MKTLSDTLRGVAKIDFITGTATRRQLEKTLTQEWLRAQRSSASLTLLLVDIDGFTAYNSHFGEEGGDACLQSVAEALRSVMLRAGDFLSRYEGGKFALLLPETDAQGAATVARRVIESVDALEIRHAESVDSAHVTVSVSGGCRDSSRLFTAKAGTTRPPQIALATAVPDDLIAAAERALKRIKLAGGQQARRIEIVTLDTAQPAVSAR
jgi:diguanylate cyclase (GGDEF)-like protein